jgi:hypothetical protein
LPSKAHPQMRPYNPEDFLASLNVAWSKRNPPTPRTDTSISFSIEYNSLDHHLHGIALTARTHHGEAVVAPG